ncbi:MAG: YraN family protein [Minisyncoccia bacterium]
MKQQKTQKREVGDLGESLACRFLENKGYTVVDRNYLKKCGEIDIIARDLAKNLRFVEVKTVSRVFSGFTGNGVNHETSDNGEFRPEDNVHGWKLERLHKTIMLYLEENNVPHETEWQIDVIVVYLDKVTKKAKIRLLERVG